MPAKKNLTKNNKETNIQKQNMTLDEKENCGSEK